MNKTFLGSSRRGHTRRRGTALIASLIVVMTVATLGATLIQVNNAITRRQMTAIDTKRAFYVGEAGLSEAFMAVSQGKSGNIASPATPATFGDGVYWVEATEDASGRIALRSTGLCGMGRFSISVVVERQVNPVASLGMFSDEELIVGEGTIVDGYDSSLGPFESQLDPSFAFDTTGSGAVLTSNHDVVLEGGGGAQGPQMPGMPNGTRVLGDSSPGPRSVTSIGPGAVVTGATAPRSDRFQAAEVVLPPNSTTGRVSHGDSIPLALSGPDVGYRTVKVASGAKLILQGPTTVVVESLSIASGGHLEIDGTNGAVRLFVTEEVTMEANSILTSVTRDPKDFSMFVTSANWFRDTLLPGVLAPILNVEPESPVQLLGEGEFVGYLYAPFSKVTVPSKLRFFGAAAALALDIEPGARISFDSAIATADINQLGLPQLVSWRVVELPDEPIVKSKLNPDTFLALQGVTPTPSKNAAVESFIEIVFRDLSGQVQTFTGAEGSMNWAGVSGVITQKWGTSLAGL